MSTFLRFAVLTGPLSSTSHAGADHESIDDARALTKQAGGTSVQTRGFFGDRMKAGRLARSYD